jgi:hypothetical protein
MFDIKHMHNLATRTAPSADTHDWTFAIRSTNRGHK